MTQCCNAAIFVWLVWGRKYGLGLISRSSHLNVPCWLCVDFVVSHPRGCRFESMKNKFSENI